MTWVVIVVTRIWIMGVLKMGLFRPLFVYFWSLQSKNTFFRQINVKMSIQYLSLGFKLTTSLIWVSSLNHQTSALSIIRKFHILGLEPRSNDYERRFILWSLWVQIPATYTGWTFFTFICCKVVMFVWRDKNKQKKAEDGPFLEVPHYLSKFVHPGELLKISQFKSHCRQINIDMAWLPIQMSDRTSGQCDQIGRNFDKLAKL